MEFGFPKKIKNPKVNDRIIFIDTKTTNMYMKFGYIRFYGFANNSKNKVVGVEFDDNVKSREDTKTYFKARIGWGAFVDLKHVRKVNDENFNLEDYKHYIESNKEADDETQPAPKVESEGIKLKQKTEMTFMDEEQENEEEGEEKAPQETQLKPSKSNSNIQEHATNHKDLHIDAETTKKGKDESGYGAKLTPVNQKVELGTKKETPTPLNPIQKPVTIQTVTTKPEPKGVQNTQLSKTATESIAKLEEENHTYYITVRQLEVQVTELKIENSDLKQKNFEINQDFQSMKENYEHIKSNTQSSEEEQIILMEKLTSLKGNKAKLEEKIRELNNALERFSDYDDFKRKFEEMSINYESIKIENADLSKKVNDSAKLVADLKEEMEIMELEADIAARDENIPNDPELLRKNYGLVQAAFQKLDLDLEIQKEEYEIKIQELNDEITSIKNNYRNILSSTEVTAIVEKKDHEIRALKDIIDQYSHANKLVEQLSEKTQKKEEQIERLKKELEKALDNIKNYEEENALLDDITRELEQTITDNDKQNADLQTKIKNLEHEITGYEDKLLKYKNKLEAVSAERETLEMQTSTLETESQKYSTLYQEYNKVLQEKQSKIREKMTYLMHGKECYWESMKWRLYFESIPASITENLHFEYFDKYKQFCNVSDRIDIIIENLVLHYLFNDNLKMDNFNLYGICKEMVAYLLKYQNYLNLLTAKYLQCSTLEDIKNLSSTVLYAEVTRSFPNIVNIYNLLRDNELSTQISFSEFIESYYRLKEDVDNNEFDLIPNLKFKYHLSDAIAKIVLLYVDDSSSLNTRETVEQMMGKLMYVNDMVFEVKIDQKSIEKIEHLVSRLPDNITDFKVWFYSFYKTIDEFYLDQNQVLNNLKVGIWNSSINSIRAELQNFENIKNDLATTKTHKAELESQLEEKNKEIIKLNKLKVNQDSKVLKLQAIANNMSTLELEVSELKKTEKKLQEELKDMTKLKKELDVKIADAPSQDLNSRQSVYKMQQVLKTKISKGDTFMGIFSKRDNSNKNIEYGPKSKFEINSLNAIIDNITNELAFYKSRYSFDKLKKFEENTPVFHKLLNDKAKEKYELANIKSAISNLKSSNRLIKHEISKLDLIDLTDKQKAKMQTKNFYSSKTKIDHYFWNTINHMEKAIETDNKILELGYDVNFEKDLLQSESKKQVIYGKLNILESLEKSKDDSSARTVSLSVTLV